MQTRGAKFRGRNPQLPPSVLSLFRLALFFLLSFPIFFPRLSPLFSLPSPFVLLWGQMRAKGARRLRVVAVARFLARRFANLPLSREPNSPTDG